MICLIWNVFVQYVEQICNKLQPSVLEEPGPARGPHRHVTPPSKAS